MISTLWNTKTEAYVISIFKKKNEKKKCALTTPGRLISMTRNSGFPSGGSLIIWYLGVTAPDLGCCASSIFLGAANDAER